MVPHLWLDSYPDVVALANRRWCDAQYAEAARQYLLAAALARPMGGFYEQLCLTMAWIAAERALGRRSELES